MTSSGCGRVCERSRWTRGGRSLPRAATRDEEEAAALDVRRATLEFRGDIGHRRRDHQAGQVEIHQVLAHREGLEHTVVVTGGPTSSQTWAERCTTSPRKPSRQRAKGGAASTRWWMGCSPLMVSTEGRLCRQAGIQGLPKLAPEERRALVQARCPDHERPRRAPVSSTRQPSFALFLHSLQHANPH